MKKRALLKKDPENKFSGPSKNKVFGGLGEKRGGKKEDFLIMVSAAILLVIIAMSGIYLKISNAPEKEILKGQIGELYSGGGNQAPSVSVINPRVIEALPQIEFNFSNSYSDADGITDLSYTRVIIDKNINNPNYTATIDYFPNTNKLRIYDKGEMDNLIAHYAFEESIG